MEWIPHKIGFTATILPTLLPIITQYNSITLYKKAQENSKRKKPAAPPFSHWPSPSISYYAYCVSAKNSPTNSRHPSTLYGVAKKARSSSLLHS